jgi:putative flippase GtrA
MSIVTNPQERTRFLKFIVVGVIGALVDFGLMNLLTKLFSLSLTLAGTISFTCAVTSNFIWNRYWTYPDSRSRPLMRQLIMFFLVNVAGIAIRVPILHFLEPPMLSVLQEQGLKSSLMPDFLAKNLTLAITAKNHQFLSHNITLASAIGIVMLWNFFVNRYWTYNDVGKVEA